MEDFLEQGIAVTAEEDGIIMSCGGIIFATETEGIIWTKVSKKCLAKGYAWARTMKETFEIMMKSIGDIKISTYIINDFCQGAKLARLIGLKKTGETEEYNGNIYYKYTAVTKCQ